MMKSEFMTPSLAERIPHLSANFSAKALLTKNGPLVYASFAFVGPQPRHLFQILAFPPGTITRSFWYVFFPSRIEQIVHHNFSLLVQNKGRCTKSTESTPRRSWIHQKEQYCPL